MPRSVNVEHPEKGTRLITDEELSKHNNSSDCWIAIEGTVYDVTKWWRSHPGGNVILSHAGVESSDVFKAFHKSDLAESKLKWLPVVGRHDAAPTPIEKDFRHLRSQLEKEGYFQSRPLYFWMSLMSILALHAVSIWMIHANTSFLSILVSAIIMGIAWGQIGFIQHDFGHKSIFKSCWLNSVGHMLTYGCWLGGIPEWWNGRHNRHHAIPNHSKWDLDIRTLPLFAWNKKMAAKAPSALLPYQAVYWFVSGPMLLMLLYKVLNAIYIVRRRPVYIIPNIIHHAWIWMAAGHLGFGGFLAWYILVILNMGNYLGWMFALNHYMLPIHDTNEHDWVTATAISTQDVDGGLLVEWITGGLCYQVEHHLFPTMPRSSYAAIRPRIEAFFAKHGLTFHHSGMMSAAVAVVRTLNAAVAKEMATKDE
eukprot:CAMPEP_0177647916 /NCGR_PEP_ID=MMETSP0447-20121125/10552_1 /TAXON_ID=0 /ORGANISM="Stygamoeba regulata, Strain BSH-02190019" /LENGTH=421 /DNA_ID=CAMNT_0019150527 /DNA_START=243 /DNA_END=1511 /DNA_ORIENTATION=+